MRKYKITNASSLNKYLASVRNPVFGIGTRPYNFTIGTYKLLKNFEILACRKIGAERHLLEKKIKVTFLDNSERGSRSIENYRTYASLTPSDLLSSKRIIKYLDSFSKRPILLFNQMPKRLESVLQNLECKGYTMVSSGHRMFSKYENKINFQKLLDRLKIDSLGYAFLNGKELSYKKAVKKVGKEFVIQISDEAFQGGTFFVRSREDFEKIKNNSAVKKAIANNFHLKVSRLADREASPSMTVCVTNFGIVNTGLQKQIIDAREVTNSERSGVFCGHDWTSSIFTRKIEREASQIAKKIGKYFKEKENFRGIFGIDFILERKTNRLYPIEANVRLLGSFPILSMVQYSARQPLIQGIQILESLGNSDYILDTEALNSLLAKPKIGAHLNLYSKHPGFSVISGNIRPGIYKINQKTETVSFLREGIFFEDLKRDNEILVTSGVPKKGQVYGKNKNLCKIVSRNTFLDKNGELNKFSKTMINYIYKKLDLKSVRTNSQ
ncbi:MAG: hypothetical protein PHF35_04570 [Candidatus Moranbacteria bacterium]|nr:hypothetical protein [Candidatus Moranbacteria bacterium]